ncbi:MAG: DUF433 domain-containing protein [Opitutae bacterium]|nr:DUF433 domain-containing protein [Opitutae bacterium]
MPDRITIVTGICYSRPIIRGTRVAVQTLLELLATGDSMVDVLAEHPALTRDDVKACLEIQD